MRIEYFELLSKIEAVDVEAGTLRAIANIPTECTIFEGHFPGYPIMPGVLLIESMAQASGHLILKSNDYTIMPFLLTVERAKMRSFVSPGQTIALDAKLVHVGSGYAVTQATVTHDGKKVAEAELKFRTMAFPSDAMKTVMLDLVARLGLPRPASE
jgi:3-hydroxyacyl-[acyl-carrier-protein] dehydratase